MTRRTVAPPLPAGPSPGLTDDVVAVLADTHDGLSDAEVRAALAERHPGLKTQKVNLLCRRLCVAGDVERVGTRPIRNRLRRSRTSSPVVDEVVDEVDGPVGVPARPCPEDTVVVTSPEPTVGPAPPVHDPDLAWSRGVNVAASVAEWLARRGATVYAAASVATGTAAPHSHDLVVRLDGADVHVEVTGWPPDSPRAHSVDTAERWFSAAAAAAVVRGRAHPDARVVLALPETRRYRTLATREACRERDPGSGPVVVPEVWFVDARGAVRPLPRFTPLVGG